MFIFFACAINLSVNPNFSAIRKSVYVNVCFPSTVKSDNFAVYPKANFIKIINLRAGSKPLTSAWGPLLQTPALEINAMHLDNFDGHHSSDS